MTIVRSLSSTTSVPRPTMPSSMLGVVDEARAREPQLQRGHQLAHVRLLELRRVVLGVLLEVAQLAGLLDGGRDRGAQLALQALQLLLEPLPGGARHHRDLDSSACWPTWSNSASVFCWRWPRTAADLLAEPEPLGDLERREQEAVARAPLPQQHARSGAASSSGHGVPREQRGRTRRPARASAAPSRRATAWAAPRSAAAPPTAGASRRPAACRRSSSSSIRRSAAAG